MHSSPFTRQRRRPSRPAAGPSHRRGGAALIVVVSLLFSLAFLGFLFYSFAKQERASAEYFSKSATPTAELPPDPFWNWALEQLIVGTDASLTNSALYGNKYSLLANMLGTPNSHPVPLTPFPTFGTASGAYDLTWGTNGSGFADVQPFDGAGLSTMVTGLNTTNSPLEFGFDLNQDGVYDPSTDIVPGGAPANWVNFVLNFSPAADITSGLAFSGSPFYRNYEPDAGYTYPDVNNLFLAYDTTVRGWVNSAAPGPSGSGTPRDFRVIIPSFFRPQLFPTRRGTNAVGASSNPSGTNGSGFGNLYINPATARQVLRPHAAHVASLAPHLRYVSPADPMYSAALGGVQAKSGDTNRIIYPFPFGVDLDNDNNFNEMGVWTNPFQGQVTPVSGVNYELDADADGDGIRDAIWMDLDYSMMTLEDGRQFVPMFGVKIVDADSLLNVNAHGNANGVYVRLRNGAIEVIGPNNQPVVGSLAGSGTLGLAELNGSTPALNPVYWHQSNLGLSPREVNLSLGLTANLRNPRHVDPDAAAPPGTLNNNDSIASQFELATNYQYTPTAAYATGESNSPTNKALANLEMLMILNGRRVFELLRNGTTRETRQQILGLRADQFKIRELYARLAGNLADTSVSGNSTPDVPSPLPGGWYLDDNGDSSILGVSSIFGTGGTGDDDYEAPGVSTSNFRRGGGSYFFDQDLYGVQMPPFVHPLDYTGLGRNHLDLTLGSATFLTRTLLPGTLTNNPSRWPAYRDDPGAPISPFNLWQHQRTPADESTPPNDLTGVKPWRLAMGGGQLQLNNPQYDFLIDDADEVILEPEYQNPEYDAVFPTYEMEALHLSASDRSKVKAGGRLSELASVNLKHVVEPVRSQIAKRFTTDSWDRLEPGQTRYQNPAAVGAFDRLWEYNIWNTGNTSALGFFTNNAAFPPEFGPNASRIYAGSTNDPFRPETRLLLKNEQGFSGSITGDLRYPRHKLNINRLLSGEVNFNAGAPGLGNIDRRSFDNNGNPRFRNLTPHANVTQMLTIGPINAVTIPAMVHGNLNFYTQSVPGVAPPLSDLGLDPTASQTDRENLIIAQEWWARYDRQRLARDIYVLLYTLGLGADETVNIAANGYPATPDVDGNGVNDKVDQMAQFAVNYVDALDRDNVITRFEYDGDLTDGWDWNTGDPYVNGVEAQQLTFSEAIWVRTARTSGPMGNYSQTPWDDTQRQHQFLCMELRSVSPFDVELADETWRIVREEIAGVRTARVTFQRNAGSGAIVPAGKNFTIGTSDGYPTGANSADLYVDHDNDSTFEGIVPDWPTGANSATLGTTLPKTDLDLVSTSTSPTNHAALQRVQVAGTLDPTMGNNGTGTMVGIQNADTNNDTITAFDLVLERRRHQQAENRLGQTDDPLGGTPDQRRDWIEVDRIRVNNPDFNPAGGSQAQILAALGQLKSSLRVEPLSAPHDPTVPAKSSTSVAVNHTILEINNPNRHRANTADPSAGSSTTAFKVWQPHFDRDFSSIFELFAVPLFGPADLTRRLADMNNHVSGLDKDPTKPQPSLAGRMFTNTDPQGDNVPPLTSAMIANDNRWYRLLEFLQVPNRAEDAIRERLAQIVRTPGKLNLNTIRDEEVLAALIDDPFIMRFLDVNGRMTMVDYLGGSGTALEPLGAGSNVNPAQPPPPAPLILPTYPDGRNIMDEMRLARDGIDPVNFFTLGVPANQTYLPLPGIPGVIGDPTDSSASEYNTTNGRPQFGAMPFRSMSYLNGIREENVATSGNTPKNTFVDPTAHTILRNHLGAIGSGGTNEVINRKDKLDQLGLFEARPTSDADGTAPDDAYDFHTRNRLLAKVANNATNRSNVFLCWIVVEYFEAHQPDPTGNPGVVQVGAKLEGSPTHRGFFVIDRTRLERAVDKESIAPVTRGDGNGYNDNFRFDWRDFVIHRRTIQ